MMKLNKKTLELEFIDPSLCFCDGGGDSGDEPDGVTFTSGEGYKAGDGIQISSSTLAPSSVGDTYGGRNTSDAALGAFAAADPFAAGAGTSPSTIQAMMDSASGGNNFTGGNIAQDFAAALTPRPQARMERRPINTQNAVFTAGTPSLLGQQTADQIAMQDANMVLPQEMYFDEVSGTYKTGSDPSLSPANLAQTAANIATGNTDVYGIGSGGEFSSNLPQSAPTSDQQRFDNIMASAQGVNRDSEVVSALSDNFLDQRGREDLNALAGDAVDYFNNPIVKGGQFVEGLLSPLGLPNIMTTAAGLPRFGSVGDMQIGIQQGGRLFYNDDGDPDYVLMPNGERIGAPRQNQMSGGGGDQEPNLGGGQIPEKPEDLPDATIDPPADTPEGLFYRKTALDTPPMNVPFGFDYDAANRRFIESYALRPDIYKSPPSLTGFTKLL